MCHVSVLACCHLYMYQSYLYFNGFMACHYVIINYISVSISPIPVFALIFVHLLAQKLNLEHFSIYSNKSFIIFTYLNPVLFGTGFKQLG